MNDPSPETSPEAVEIASLLLKKAEGGEYGASVDVQVTILMGRAKAGDRAAFDELAGLLRNRAFRLAQSLVGSREDALDLTQEAFLKTYRSRQSYRDDQPFLPWFHRILRNTCFSFLRKHKRLQKHSLSGGPDEDDGEWTLPDDGPAPSARAEAEERTLAFRRAFHTLKATDREILTLRHFEELSYRAIARTLEIPEGTVMSRLFHARRRLRDALSTSTAMDTEPASDEARDGSRLR